MKNKVVKLFCFFLVLVISISLTACFNDVKAGKEEDIKPQNTNQEKVKLRIEVFDRAIKGYNPEKNFMTRWIQKEFGDKNNIELEYVSIPRWEEEQKLDIMMASNDTPDIVFTYNPNLVYSYVKSKSIYDLTGTLDIYGKNLKKYLGEEVLEYGRWNGGQYSIPAKRVLRAVGCTFIRQDWLDILKLPQPTTTEEFYQTIKEFKEKDPGKLGDKNVPLLLVEHGQHK